MDQKASKLQMIFLGFISAFIGILCLLIATVVYKLPGLTSISESATTGNKLGMLLPFALGCMFTYCFGYQGYCKSERIIVKIMGCCFMLVAFQICGSSYVSETKVGIFGLSKTVSNIVHLSAAVSGFGLMWVWIQFYFTKSDKTKTERTKQKTIRNYVYISCGVAMLCGILMIAISSFINMGNHIVFIVEEFLLIPAGFAIMVKGGLFLKDKNIKGGNHRGL